MVIIGTPFPDQFVIDGLEIYGAGRYTRAINIQRFVVASQEGNDEIYLLSSSPYCNTAITAGKGSDKIFITPSSVPPVAAKTQGQSGVIRHTFDSARYTDEAPDKKALEKALAVIDGFFSYVINRDVPTLVLDMERDDKRLENTVVFESGLFVSNVPVSYKKICYRLRLASTGNVQVPILVRMPKTLTNGLTIMLMYVDGVAYDDPLKSFVVSTSKTVEVCLKPNPAAYFDLERDLSNFGERYLAVTHSQDTSLPQGDDCKKMNCQAPVLFEMPGMFFVRLLITHEPGVHLVAPTRQLSIIEGNTSTGQKDSYEMMLLAPGMCSS